MLQFFKYTTATIVGFFISLALLCIGFIVFIAILLSSDTAQSDYVEKNSVLVLNLSGDIHERVIDNPLAMLTRQTRNEQGLEDILCAIEEATYNDNIKGIYIEAGMVNADCASLQEIRNALQRFRNAKKWIISYANEYTQGAYYVCSVSDQVYVNPQGMVDLHGVSVQPMFIKDVMAKFGVKMKVIKVGTYKSATEIYTEDQMSEPNKEQVTRFINATWQTVKADIAKDRKITIQEIDACADSLSALQPTSFLIRHSLVDKTAYAEDMKAVIRKKLGIKEKDDIKQIDSKKLHDIANLSDTESDAVAVYYCEGSIVQTSEANIMESGSGIVSKKMIKDLEELGNDTDIKAVVIRINSGGGDAFASEEIWHAVSTLRKKKPVIISMGGKAASGAYYLSAGASYIFAQPTTLTGSIGIFGAFPDLSGLFTQKIGVKFDNVKTNKHSDFDIAQMARPFNADEEAMLQLYINRGYELFCKRVSDGRKIPLETVKHIAEGRVWVGIDALKIHLVDELGGLDKAIAKAATMAKLKGKKYAVKSYPSNDWIDMLYDAAPSSNLDSELRATLGTLYEPFIMLRTIKEQSPIQARCTVLFDEKF